MRRYHHIGIPTTEAKPSETHLAGGPGPKGSAFDQ
jgi:hypothetical protein